jgi:hypothetical protein
MISKRLIILTAFFGQEETLKRTIENIISQLDKDDAWVIVLDNQSIDNLILLKKKYSQLIFLKNCNLRGAGICRNIGLDYIKKNINGEFLLLPFDGDDTLTSSAVRIIKNTMINTKFKVISFAHKKIWANGTQKVIRYSGVYSISDLLKKYITPCGSTVIKIHDSKILKHFRFGSRFRANDALFFYQVIKYFKKFKCRPEIVLNYKIGNPDSLSGKKLRMIYYKYMSYIDFGLSGYKALVYTMYYILNGIRRYYFKKSV